MNKRNVKTIGIVGGNLTSALLMMEASKKGIETILLDKDINNIAAKFATKHMVGVADKVNIERLNLRTDAIVFCTTEIEEWINQITFKVPTFPSVDALNFLGNRLEQLTLSEVLDIPTPDYYYQDNSNVEEVLGRLDEIDIPFVFHQMYEEVVESEDILNPKELETFIEEIDSDAKGWMIESINTYKKILTVTLLKDDKNKVYHYPITEEMVENDESSEIYTPASISQTMAQRINRYTRKIAKAIQGEGLFTFKFGMKANKQIELINITPGITVGEIASIHCMHLSVYEQMINLIAGEGCVEPVLYTPSRVAIVKEGMPLQNIKLPYNKYIVGEHSDMPIEIYIIPEKRES